MGLTGLQKDSKRASDVPLRDIVAHLAENRAQLREEWVRRINDAQLLTAMTKDELFAEATSVYDSYVDALETRTLESLEAYAQNLSERIIPRGVETHEVVGIVLLLRDVLARSLFTKYHDTPALLDRVLDAYEPAANSIAITVAVGFVRERERVIRQQQESIRELSTPVLQVRERLLIQPIIGVIDPHRARQLTEQLLRGIRDTRARVVVIDITGVAAMDANVANHLVLTVEAARLLGASVIVTGLSPEIAQTLVNIGVDLGKMRTVGDLQSALADADIVHLRDALVEKVGRHRSLGVIIDVTALDVMDSFATGTLRDMAHMVRLRGAETVIVGIQPDVAFAMVHMGLKMEGVATALDLEEGLAYLDQRTRAVRHR